MHIKKIKVFDKKNNNQIFLKKLKSRNNLSIVLTGGIASGKSYITKVFRKLGFCIISSDTLVGQILRRKSIQDELLKFFGQKIFPNDQFCKKTLSNIMWANPNNILFMEKLLHSEVFKLRNNIIERIKLAKRSVIMEIPLFFEKLYNSNLDYDAIFTTYCTSFIQQKRGLQKGMTIDKLFVILNNQTSNDIRKSYSDLIINTTGNQLFVKCLIKKIVKNDKYFKRSRLRYRNDRIEHQRWT